MPTCCCTNDGEGHRCPYAWQLIILAQQARARGRSSWEMLHAARQAYSAHLADAKLHPPGTDGWADLCTITMAEDPRCPQCSREETR